MKLFKCDFNCNQPTQVAFQVPQDENYSVGIKVEKNGEKMNLSTDTVTVTHHGTEISGTSMVGDYVRVNVPATTDSKIVVDTVNVYGKEISDYVESATSNEGWECTLSVSVDGQGKTLVPSNINMWFIKADGTKYGGVLNGEGGQIQRQATGTETLDGMPIYQFYKSQNAMYVFYVAKPNVFTNFGTFEDVSSISGITKIFFNLGAFYQMTSQPYEKVQIEIRIPGQGETEYVKIHEFSLATNVYKSSIIDVD